MRIIRALVHLINALIFTPLVYIASVRSASLPRQLVPSDHASIEQIWNVFDTSFIIICVVYVCLRIKGLASHDRERGKLFVKVLVMLN